MTTRKPGPIELKVTDMVNYIKSCMNINRYIYRLNDIVLAGCTMDKYETKIESKRVLESDGSKANC